MTFQATDILPYSSAPIELYHFNQTVAGVLSNYYYTSSDTSFYDGTVLWAAEPMDHDEFEISSLLERVGLTINCSQDFPMARFFLYPSPPAPIGIRLSVMQREDTDFTRQTIFVGTVKNCAFEEEEAHLSCESVQTAIKKTGLQRAHSRTCNHVLYEPNTCKVNSAGFLSTGTIQSISNQNQRVVMTLSPDRPNDWFTAGELIHPTGPRTMVVQHQSLGGGQHQMDLIRPATEIVVAGAVTMTAGCKRTYDVCNSKFANQVNYGGFPFAPVTNPFETSFFN